MMYSILTCHEINGNRVSGGWVQHSIGDLAKAIGIANATSKVNGGARFAVVNEVSAWDYHTDKEIIALSDPVS